MKGRRRSTSSLRRDSVLRQHRVPLDTALFHVKHHDLELDSRGRDGGFMGLMKNCHKLVDSSSDLSAPTLTGPSMQAAQIQPLSSCSLSKRACMQKESGDIIQWLILSPHWLRRGDSSKVRSLLILFLTLY